VPRILAGQENWRSESAVEIFAEPKAPMNAPQSRRFAKFSDAGWSRQRLKCGGFSTALEPRNLFLCQSFPDQPGNGQENDWQRNQGRENEFHVSVEKNLRVAQPLEIVLERVIVPRSFFIDGFVICEQDSKFFQGDNP
jgi:hypothetical protein